MYYSLFNLNVFSLASMGVMGEIIQKITKNPVVNHSKLQKLGAHKFQLIRTGVQIKKVK